MNLHVLAYNLRRMISILGPDNLIAAMRHKASSLIYIKYAVYARIYGYLTGVILLA
jgi:hypothetical protein